MLAKETSVIEISHNLLPEERRRIISEILHEHGSVHISSLAEQMNINPATIRRDLREMALHEDIRLVHGGALIASPVVKPVTNSPDLMIKRTANIEVKKQIAQKATSLINDGDIIALSSGSTVELILDYLPKSFESLTIFTLSLSIAYKASKILYVNLLIPGGSLRRTSQALIGASTVKFISTLRIDKGFFGAQAVDVDAGFTESNLSEVETNIELFKVCSHRYLAADSSKFGQVALGHISDLDEFDGLIVDENIPESIRSWAKASEILLI